LPIKDVGMFECDDCGEVIERWHGKQAPLFRAVASPKRRTPNAA
jgi:hypothetical protein